MSDDTRIAEDVGLSIDMLDVDRLREWARLLLVHGADIGHWGSVPHVAGKLQIIATNVEQAIRDIGSLRAALDAEREKIREALMLAEHDDLKWLALDYQKRGDLLRQANERIKHELARAEAADAALARVQALPERWDTSADKDYKLRHDDVEDGVWAFQHEAAGRYRQARKCAAELREALAVSRPPTGGSK